MQCVLDDTEMENAALLDEMGMENAALPLPNAENQRLYEQVSS
jgi:hypothetical protein